MTRACPCGCAVAAWSMPWPVRVAPWSPAVVHEPGATTGAVVPALFPVEGDGPDPVAPDLVAADLVDPDLTVGDLITPDLIDTEVIDPRAIDPEAIDPRAIDSAVVDTDLIDTEHVRPRRAS